MNVETIGLWAGAVWNALNDAKGTLDVKGLKKATKLKEKEVFAKFTATIASELQYADVFADSTCINEASRKKLIIAVKKLNKDFDIVALYFYNDNILDRCLTQNARRSGRARVPDEAIINMCASFTIPKKSEGFKYVINVLEDDIYKRYC